ncbi:MAG: hypothetical protein COY42_29680 [Armatimonadetes bacterium CG_4_10_14_0_8_um_filter_66_14]|nr:MAG: hypothetical protein COY42_29680 [Armatimonadetes bacterium CG_4_10_14_0_8_um_filter_66_14]
MIRRWLALLGRLVKPALLCGLSVVVSLLLLTSPANRLLTDAAVNSMRVLSQRTTTARASAPLIVERLQALNRLETVRQVSSQIVEAKSSCPLLGDFLSGDNLLMSTQAEVVAGIDLAKLSPADLIVEDNAVTVHLPAPQVFSVRLIDDNSKVHLRRHGLLVRNPDPDLERQTRLQATASAREAALQGELLETARANAETSLRPLLEALGFRQIAFQASQTEPAATPAA